MSHITDNRSGKNFPCTVKKITSTQIVVVMAGPQGYEIFTSGADGTATVNDDPISYNVELPGLKSDVGKLEVTFKRE